MTEQVFYDIDDLMRMFGVSRGTIYNWFDRGLQFSYVGGRRFVSKADLEAFIRPGDDQDKTAEDSSRLKTETPALAML